MMMAAEERFRRSDPRKKTQHDAETESQERRWIQIQRARENERMTKVGCRGNGRDAGKQGRAGQGRAKQGRAGHDEVAGGLLIDPAVPALYKPETGQRNGDLLAVGNECGLPAFCVSPCTSSSAIPLVGDISGKMVVYSRLIYYRSGWNADV